MFGNLHFRRNSQFHRKSGAVDLARDNRLNTVTLDSLKFVVEQSNTRDLLTLPDHLAQGEYMVILEVRCSE